MKCCVCYVFGVSSTKYDVRTCYLYATIFWQNFRFPLYDSTSTSLLSKLLLPATAVCYSALSRNCCCIRSLHSSAFSVLNGQSVRRQGSRCEDCKVGLACTWQLRLGHVSTFNWRSPPRWSVLHLESKREVFIGRELSSSDTYCLVSTIAGDSRKDDQL